MIIFIGMYCDIMIIKDGFYIFFKNKMKNVKTIL